MIKKCTFCIISLEKILNVFYILCVHDIFCRINFVCKYMYIKAMCPVIPLYTPIYKYEINDAE